MKRKGMMIQIGTGVSRSTMRYWCMHGHACGTAKQTVIRKNEISDSDHFDQKLPLNVV